MIKTACLIALVAAISTYGNPPDPQKPPVASPGAAEPVKPAAPEKGGAETPKTGRLHPNARAPERT